MYKSKSPIYSKPEKIFYNYILMAKSNYEDYFTEQDIIINPELPSYIKWDTIRERL